MKKIFFTLFFSYIMVFGHPHMFATVNLDVKNQAKEIHNVSIEWVFDEMNSAMLIMDYDKNFDKKFSHSESMKFKKNVFDTLGEFSYYTHLKIDGKKIDIKNLVKKFALDLRDNKFVVQYSLDLTKFKAKKEFYLGFWDEEFYTSMELMKKNVKFKEKIAFKISELQDDIYLGYILKVGK